MKKRKFIAIFLVIVMAAVGLIACGPTDGGDVDGKVKLNVVAINKGYGTAWLHKMAKEFGEANNCTVKVTEVYDDTVIRNNLESGADYCNYDVMFTGMKEISEEMYLADLTDIYNSDLNGKTVAETIDPNLLKSYKRFDDEGNVYYNIVPWTGGIDGLIINKSVVTEKLGAGWEDTYKLRTTDELLTFCAALQNVGLAPFIHAANTNYYHFLYEVWWAQYEGVEGLERYYNGLYWDEDEECYKEGPQCVLQEGKLESLKVMEDIFGGGYSYKDSNGIEWETTQTYFMLGRAAMFSNGDWNNLEMSKTFPNAQTVMVRTPIVSALGSKLGVSEADLIKVIDYVDAVIDGNTPAQKPEISISGTKTVDEVIALVHESRIMQHSYGDYFTAGIPSYSKNLALAKDFLKFMMSTRGQEIFAEQTGGLTMCYGYDLESNSGYNGFSPFAKSRWAIAKEVTYTYTRDDLPYGQAGLGAFMAKSSGPIEVIMSRTSNRYTAQMVYENDFDYYDGANWTVVSTQAQAVKERMKKQK